MCSVMYRQQATIGLKPQFVLKQHILSLLNVYIFCLTHTDWTSKPKQLIKVTPNIPMLCLAVSPMMLMKFSSIKVNTDTDLKLEVVAKSQKNKREKMIYKSYK